MRRRPTFGSRNPMSSPSRACTARSPSCSRSSHSAPGLYFARTWVGAGLIRRRMPVFPMSSMKRRGCVLVVVVKALVLCSCNVATRELPRRAIELYGSIFRTSANAALASSRRPSSMNARPSRLRASRSSGEPSTSFWFRSAARGQSASSAAAVAWSASARARRPASVICGTGLPPTREGTPGSGALGYTNCTGYASGVVPYLSEIQHRRVIEPNGNEVGKLADVALVPQGQFPAAQWAILATPRGEKVVKWSDLAMEIGHLRLRSRLDATPEATLPPDALRLARDLLDKQIVDTHGAKVVRVNDLQLSDTDGQLRLVGADVGLRGLLRRVGAESVAERVAGLAGRKLPRGIIPWHLVEPLEATETATHPPAVRLTIPHQKLALLHPADIADVVEEMTADERVAVFQQLDIETAADTLQEVEPEMQAAIVSDLPEERAADILEEMDPDEAADLLQDLPEDRREELVDLMEKEEASDVEELLTYPEDSAGGIMTTDFVALPGEQTAAQSIDQLREKKPDPELTYYLYVVDAQGKLEGVLSLRDLVVAPPETKVTAIMDPNILKVSAETPKEDVASLIAKYDLLALPVVDARGRLRGTVTVDDVVELMLPRGWKKRSGRTLAR